MALQRIANDLYPSPIKLIEAWLKVPENTRHFDPLDTMLECCDGFGDISNSLRAQGYDVEATDITDGSEYDATTAEYWEDRSPDWVFTNPPFNYATPIITNALSACNKGVIMILRASYLEPCKDRRHVLDSRISHISYVNPRPKFRADTKGTDSSTVVFITWLKHKSSRHSFVSYLTDWNR